MIVTIDGPAGVGKSTVSKLLSQRLSYLYLDTGALYRTFAYLVSRRGILPHDESRLKQFLAELQLALCLRGEEIYLLANGSEVAETIRTEEIGVLASTLSALPMVREKLLHIQREAAHLGNLVAEGRDMGTVVFPQAEHKFFLEASLEERVERRYRELVLRGGNVVQRDAIRQGMEMRDRQDTNRATAPLRRHPEAFVIDTTGITVEEVVRMMIRIITERESPPNKLDI